MLMIRIVLGKGSGNQEEEVSFTVFLLLPGFSVYVTTLIKVIFMHKRPPVFSVQYHHNQICFSSYTKQNLFPPSSSRE